MIFVGICFLSFYLMNNINDLKSESNIISQFQDNGQYHYIIKDENSYSIKSYKSEVKSTDGKLYYYVLHPIVGLSFVAFIISVIVLIIFTINNDCETGWELSECWTSAKLSLVKCEIEDDIYYYHYRGKLLCKSERQLWPSQLNKFIDQPINLLPDFPGTKSQRRDKKLKELFDEN